MKHFIIIILFFILIIGCSSQDCGTNSNSNLNDSIALYKEKLLKQSELIAGYWLSDNYLRKIEKTKSIYINRNYDTKLFGFILDKENLLSDSAYLNGFNFHEGGYGSAIFFDLKKNMFVNDLKRIEKSPEFPDQFELKLINDSLIEMNFLKSKIVDTYRKVADAQTELRRILFEGDYLSMDKEEKITFYKDGKLKGFGDNIYYELVYDFVDGIKFDAVVFYKTKNGGNWLEGDMFQYKFVSDTLVLYHILPLFGDAYAWDNILSYKIIKNSP